MLLENYLSPENETSFFKGIPMFYRNSDEIRNLLMTKLFNVKYRGPSNVNYQRPQSHCIKEHATSFAIYKKGTY